MPQVYQPVEKSKVIAILVKRGYGIDSCPGYEFRLCKPTGLERKSGVDQGTRRMAPLGGIRRPDWKRITKYCKDEDDAANQAEAICTGKALTGSSAGMETPSAGPDMATLAKLVDNRMAGQRAEFDAKIDRLTSLLERLVGGNQPEPEPVATLPPAEAAIPEQPEVVMGYAPEEPPKPKGKGWPKGKPRGPRKQKETAAAQ